MRGVGRILGSMVGEAKGMAVQGVAVAGFGYAINRWRDKAHVAGVPVDLAAGVGLTALALLGVGGGRVRHVARKVGHAGLYSFLHTMGAGMGAQHSGVKRLLIPASDMAKAKAALPNATILGEIPKAPHGDFLSSEKLAALARA